MTERLAGLRPRCWPRLLLCLAAAGCAPKLPPVREAALALPTDYVALAQDGRPAVGPAAPGAAAAQRPPAAFYPDPLLAALIDEALANNQEMNILGQEIAVAEAEVEARRGELLPRLGIGARAGADKVGRHTSRGAAEARSEIEDGVEVPEPLGDLGVGLEASWEVDIWKRLRNATAAARARALATAEGRRFATTVLVAELAEAYVELMALDNQLQIVENNVALLEDSLRVVRLQKEAARSSELAVQRFDAERLQSLGQAVQLRQQIIETEVRINLLCGRSPQPVARSSGTFVDTALAPPAMGTVAALLDDRPDIREAAAALEAAKLDVKVARGLFYPSLSIDAALGVEAYAASKLASLPASLAYGASAGVLAPLLNRKAIKAQYTAANAQQLQAVLAYERTVLTAHAEVLTHAADVENMGQLVSLKVAQVGRLQAAVETSTQLFRSARADYLEVLTTRRDALEARLELVEARKSQLAAVISLYQSLGGGWTAPAATP